MFSSSESARCTGLHRPHRSLAAPMPTQVTLPAGRREVNDRTSAVVSRPSGKSQASARRLNRRPSPRAATYERSRSGNGRQVSATPSTGTP
jgi:hypothetical protein